MVTEIELKFSILDVKDMAIESIITNLFKEQKIEFLYQEKQLGNHYFDTQDLALRSQRIALRTRSTKTNKQAICFEQTIKTSGRIIAGLHQRPEYNVDISDEKPILALFPNNLWQKNTDLVALQQNIIEMFSTNFTRHTWLITSAEAQIELAFDSGKIGCKGYENKPRIFEIELELISGSTDTLFSLTQQLFTKLPLRSGQLTKAARGYALHKESLANGKVNKNKASDNVCLTEKSFSDENKSNETFKAFIEHYLKTLQFGIDDYQEFNASSDLELISRSIEKLAECFEQVATFLTTEGKKIGVELSYFIELLHEKRRKHAIEKLDVLYLLHSERFNLLQLSLLALLLNDANYTQLIKSSDDNR